MTTNHTNGIGTAKAMRMSFIFHEIGDPAGDVVAEALRHRAKASRSAHDALNAAIDNAGIQLDGFKKPSLAQPPSVLNELVLSRTRNGNDKLASAILRVWAESHADLAGLVTAHLEEQGVSVLDSKRDVFSAIWPKRVCAQEAAGFSEQHREFEPHDVELMLCYLSGRFPLEKTFGSALFEEWFDLLENLPPDAPEWDDSPDFVSALTEMSKEKIASRGAMRREAFDATVAEIEKRFEGELNYLSIDINLLRADAMAVSRFPQAGALAEELAAELEAYQEVRPQAATRDEEQQRAGERNEREAVILSLANALRELTIAAEEPDGSSTPDTEAPNGTDETSMVSPVEYTALQSAMSKLQDRVRYLEQKYGQAQAVTVERTKERDDARAKVTNLQGYIAKLERERGQAKPTSDDTVATDPQPAGAEAEQPQPRSVHEAIATACERFPDTLAIALNSASEEDSPFQRPDEVYAALAWLAGEYHSLRANPPGPEPQFDILLKQSCSGWSYSSKQSSTAKNMSPSDYQTSMDGRIYTLDKHIGKGVKGDPQYMIRIAFDWDGDSKKVVVGYIGRHQRTQAS